MNPLLIARNLREEYLRLLRTAFHPRQQALADAFNAEIEKDGFLTREPFIALAQAYKYAPAIRELHSETQRRFGVICQTPYQHQAEACQRILSGQPTVVATGTGSGKTEAFLMPIVDHCIRVHTLGDNSVKAILVYPMNALANDQNNRIRKLLDGTDISFGRYTRETKMFGARPADAPPNERVLRTEFRASPPDLLLTNYMMLEYMLMRGDGRQIFQNHQVRFIVLDEVHTYHGMLGTDVACLMRRLREALRRSNAGVSPLFIGTSATLQAGEEDDPKTGVATFFTRLTGQATPAEGVITESSDTPMLPAGLTLGAPPEITEEELTAFEPGNDSKVESLIQKLAASEATEGSSVTATWMRMALPYLLLNWLKQPRSEEEVIGLLSEQPERGGVSREALRHEIEATLLVGPSIPELSGLKLRPRAHRFLRGLARFWRCTSPTCGKLLGEGIDRCDECQSRSLPLALCRTCGWDFFMAEQGQGGTIQPWTYRVSRPNTLFLFDPPASHVDIEEEEDLSGEEEVTEEVAGQTSVPQVEDTCESAEGGEIDSGPGIEYLDPVSLRLGERQEGFGFGAQVRPVRVHRGRGTRCPVCRSRYGRFDVLTPVSLGNSSALAHISRAVMRDLPESERKLLIFCDSRQDAAHQARFIQGVEGHLRMRRSVYQALANESERHDFEWLVERLYQAYIEEGVFSRSRRRDQQRRDKAVIEGEILNEFVIAARVRAGLERLGLVKVRYVDLEEQLSTEEFRRFCADYDLLPDVAAQSVRVLLDVVRHRMALDHEVLRRRLYPGDELSRRYQIKVNRYIGRPAAFAPPEQKSVEKKSYKLIATWNAKGNPTSIQRLWRQFHYEKATPDSLEALLRWLQRNEYLSWQEIGSANEQDEGYQVALGSIEFEAGRSFLHCSICDKIASNELPGVRCSRAGCEGTMRIWQGPIADGNLNALMAVENYAPALYPAEHSAAVSDEEREKAEVGFMSGVPPKPNILVCTPTLEMGVNIGDLEGVAMRNIPPSPANYAQRSGRTGRVSRMGITAGFSRNTPHDGYFFDHPEEIIAGAIPPPKFNLSNLEAIGRHVRSLIIEHAEIDFPSSLEPYLTERGELVEHTIQELLQRVAQASRSAVETALRLWADVTGVTDDFATAIAVRFPQEIRAALEERGQLIADAAEEVRKLGEILELTPKQRHAQDGYRELGVRLRKDNKYAYLPRVLAEAGLLPGYAFPGDPGSVSLGYDPEPVFASRLQAQREFAPGQIVYARGGRWRVGGVALHRPGSGRSSATRFFDFTLCGSCGMANDPKNNFCVRCNASIGDETGSGLASFTAWDVGAFQAWDAEVEADSEEERAVQVFDIRPHPQFDTSAMRYSIGEWTLDLREQEEIWFINHGAKEAKDLAQDKAQSPGFTLCAACGEYFSRSEIERQRAAQARERTTRAVTDERSQINAHQRRCSSAFRSFSLGHQVKADTLRLNVPYVKAAGEEGVAWAWSFVYSMIQGAIRLFEIDEEDIDAYVLTKSLPDADGNLRNEILDILWIDRVVGGSGVLQRLANNFPRVAGSALRHLDGHECPSSCYRCLRSYRNQRWHKMLDWRLVVPFLRPLASETVTAVGAISAAAPTPSLEGPEWDEARGEGCESPQELRLLNAIRADGTLPEPVKQHEVSDAGRLLTRADFAYLDCDPKILIYVDGLQWHSSIRQRVHDGRTTNRLQMLGFRVLRFLGTETHNTPESCVDQIRQARG
jgi:ATP-dependent helicase YprA (DUF1998 family)